MLLNILKLHVLQPWRVILFANWRNKRFRLILFASFIFRRRLFLVSQLTCERRYVKLRIIVCFTTSTNFSLFKTFSSVCIIALARVSPYLFKRTVRYCNMQCSRRRQCYRYFNQPSLFLLFAIGLCKNL